MEERNISLYREATKLGFLPQNLSIGWKEDFYLWMCELQRWLREKHNISVLPYYNEIGRGYGYSQYNTKDFVYINKQSVTWDTYEEALEEGLKQALLIK